MLFFINFNKKYNLLEELIENKSKTLIVNQIDIFKRIYNNIIKIQKRSKLIENKKKMSFQLQKRDKYNNFTYGIIDDTIYQVIYVIGYQKSYILRTIYKLVQDYIY